MYTGVIILVKEKIMDQYNEKDQYGEFECDVFYTSTIIMGIENEELNNSLAL